MIKIETDQFWKQLQDEGLKTGKSSETDYPVGKCREKEKNKTGKGIFYTQEYA